LNLKPNPASGRVLIYSRNRPNSPFSFSSSFVFSTSPTLVVASAHYPPFRPTRPAQPTPGGHTVTRLTWGRVNPNSNPANPAWLEVTQLLPPQHPYCLAAPVSCLTLSRPCPASTPHAVVALDPSRIEPKKERSRDDQRGQFIPYSIQNEFDETMDSLSNFTPL
jgi:hypothetical protein